MSSSETMIYDDTDAFSVFFQSPNCKLTTAVPGRFQASATRL